MIAPGFNLYEQKEIEVEARETTIADAQLTIALEDQQVTIDDRHISTDSDNNANAVVLRGRELEALPNDPQALASALPALAGPTDPESGGTQIKVDGFSDGQIPPKEAIREVRINNNPFSAENEFPGLAVSRSSRNRAVISGPALSATTSTTKASTHVIRSRINNLFNRTNFSPPVGNMTSPYFLKSPSGSSTFFFGPGGGASGNRVISLRVRVSF